MVGSVEADDTGDGGPGAEGAGAERRGLSRLRGIYALGQGERCIVLHRVE